MAKKTNTHVTIKRNGIKKEVSIAQWNAMKTDPHGWKLASDISEDILEKEVKIEASQIKELEGTVKTLSEENTTLKENNQKLTDAVSEKDSKISELISANSELEGTVKTLSAQLEGLKANSTDKTVKDGDKKNSSK